MCPCLWIQSLKTFNFKQAALTQPTEVLLLLPTPQQLETTQKHTSGQEECSSAIHAALVTSHPSSANPSPSPPQPPIVHNVQTNYRPLAFDYTTIQSHQQPCISISIQSDFASITSYKQQLRQPQLFSQYCIEDECKNKQRQTNPFWEIQDISQPDLSQVYTQFFNGESTTDSSWTCAGGIQSSGAANVGFGRR